jgi:CRP-like cAMP-binding protein
VTHEGNHLIELLPRKPQRSLLAVCEAVDLTIEQVLCEAGDETRYAYFPTSAFVSLISEVDGKSCLEVGMVGREGILGVHLALGVATTPLRALVQGAGSAWRVEVGDLRREVATHVALRRTVDRYVYVLMSQFAVAAACVRFHLIDARLARWLLMTQDRADSSSFQVTHEFLAYMLGVRRVGVTTAAGALQRRGLITYHRGQLEVLDRTGLEGAACSCYASDRRAYRRQLP